ncbi:MAG: hypothetical protein GY708_14590 [Actinomycetia bacterium]|nr:hypothetical protein [Actinomycetes bacterium]
MFQVRSTPASKALEALAALGDSADDSVRDRDDWRQVFEQGPIGVVEHERPADVLSAVENAAPYSVIATNDLESLGATSWALDAGGINRRR